MKRNNTKTTNGEKISLKDTERALLNILDDYSDEKGHAKESQKAFLNILEDYGEEKKKVESLNEYLSGAKELEQFAYVASHDLQEPLRTISNFSGLLAKKYSGQLDSEADIYFNFILKATSTMQSLIKGLLDFSKVGRDVVFSVIDTNEILEDIITALEIRIKETNTKITADKLPVLKGNEIELGQLFQNLIINAIKFQEKSNIPEIAIKVEERETEYLFSFKDNGIGLDENHLERIFVIFGRLHTVDEYPGTGIGLATCKKIVALHNGKIWIESKLGEGSTFYFTISKEH
jgi:light-regulated signal transduction histidine kinase (bacteriophytochrome)